MSLKRDYKLAFKKEALKNLEALDKPQKEQIYKKLVKRCKNPKVPSAMLRGELAGLYKIKIKGIRAVYQVKDDTLTILILVIDKRENNKIYSEEELLKFVKKKKK